jgi:hypothetical protein
MAGRWFFDGAFFGARNARSQRRATQRKRPCAITRRACVRERTLHRRRKKSARVRGEKTRCHFETLTRTIRRTFARATRQLRAKSRVNTGFFGVIARMQRAAAAIFAPDAARKLRLRWREKRS